jgi:hypothetical protein
LFDLGDEPRRVELPGEMQKWRAELLREHKARAEAAKQHFWNGKNYAISDFSVARTVVEEEPEVFFRVQHSDYGVFLAAQQLERTFKDGVTLREKYVAPYEEDRVTAPAFMSSAFGTSAAVLTADGYFIFLGGVLTWARVPEFGAHLQMKRSPVR